MNIESKKSLREKREYITSKTQYWYYEIDVTSNNKIAFYLSVNGIEYIIPRTIFKHAIWLWNHHQWISDYIFDLSKIWIFNNIKVVQPTPELLIVSTLTKIVEYIQINNQDNSKVKDLLKSIKESIKSLI